MGNSQAGDHKDKLIILDVKATSDLRPIIARETGGLAVQRFAEADEVL
jgi:hypothetical protein